MHNYSNFSLKNIWSYKVYITYKILYVNLNFIILYILESNPYEFT